MSIYPAFGYNALTLSNIPLLSVHLESLRYAIVVRFIYCIHNNLYFYLNGVDLESPQCTLPLGVSRSVAVCVCVCVFVCDSLLDINESHAGSATQQRHSSPVRPNVKPAHMPTLVDDSTISSPQSLERKIKTSAASLFTIYQMIEFAIQARTQKCEQKHATSHPSRIPMQNIVTVKKLSLLECRLLRRR